MHLICLERFLGRHSKSRSHDDANHSRVRLSRLATNGAARSEHNAANSHPSPSASFPEALPSDNVTDLYPELRCPLANVVLTDPCELQPWLSVARPVTREFAESVGGCIVLLPSASSCSPDSPESSSDVPRYYCVAWCDDAVYGRARYLPSPSASHEVSDHCHADTANSNTCHGALCAQQSAMVEALVCWKGQLLARCSKTNCSSNV